MTESEWLTSEDPQAMLDLRRTECCGCWWKDNRDGTVSLCLGSRPCGQCDNGPILPYAPWSDRKLRLFACACVRRVWGRLTEMQKTDVVFAEREPWYQSALGGTLVPEYLSSGDLTEYTKSVGNERSVANAVRWLGAQNATQLAQQSPEWLQRVSSFRVQAHILRDIVGNPWRPSGIREWLTPDVIAIARAAYEEREPEGALQACHLLPLSDALEDAGGSDILEVCQACSGCGKAVLFRVCRGLWPEDVEQECRPCSGVGRIKKPNPVIAHLRSPGPHYRGCWVLDLILGKE